MKGKSKLIALVVMLVLMMQMTGCGEAAVSNENTINTWAGYEADAANGLRVKEVIFTDPRYSNSGESIVHYDIEGNITDLSISDLHFDYAPFFEKALGISVPFMYHYDSSYGFELHKYSLINMGLARSGSYQLVKKGGTYYLIYQKSNTDDDCSICFLEDGRCIEELHDIGNSSYSLAYNYDSYGRVIKWSNGFGYEEKYTYEGDSSYLKSVDGEDIITFEYDYDTNNNLIRVEEYAVTEEGQIYGSLVHMWEYEYDENGNVVCETVTAGSDKGDIVTTHRYEYDENGNAVCETETVSSDEGDTVITYRCQYDNDGNMIEKCTYKTFGSEEYMTQKTEYVYYGNTGIYQTRDTYYSYEANADFSIVNLTNTEEEAWRYVFGRWEEGCDEVFNCWTVTYYTQEEIDQYTHDQEFHSVY